MLFPLLDVRANLCFGSARGQQEIALDDVLECLEIWHLLDRKVRHLSGGERQRVALGRALMSSPDILLLDEPFASLDAPRRQRMVERLAQIRKTWSLPMVLVSHHLDDVEALVDEVFQLSDGQLV
jgi:molybdate transport system ATP-binding protein